MGVGISVLIGLKATVLLISFYFIRELGVKLVHLPLLHASIVSYLVAIASHPAVNLSLLLGKASDGIFPFWSLVLYAPFLIFVWAFVPLRRLWSREPPYTEILEGLYVGGWPYSAEHLPPGKPAVIDCTCELPRTRVISGNSYLCIPTWDTRAPDPSQIESAVRWACRKRVQMVPVYIHCAFGHGRSVCVMCAVLVALGLAEDWKSAEKIIREKRPFIHMNALHRKSLEQWSKNRLSFKKDGSAEVNSVLERNKL